MILQISKGQQIPGININFIQENDDHQKQNQDQLRVLDISSTDEDDNFIQDLKIEEDTSEWALLVALYALLKIEKKDYVTKYEIQDQIKILKFSFDIAIKRQSVYQTLRTQKQLISEITDDQMDETFYCLTEIGKNLARNFIQLNYL
ncbi:hypothetical protein PPERSA_06925 [Pseudocohnilembus persalinus]|uniref:Uncharacterized protein n=1 Tax=Pseudocohnilembus persalinus TaxID=266149 RepID=A0A0V0QYL4_PSEPJ|nr:hypothetical protein PPERSA_06925 [Pseudocohnilembus persalinus]|eukprot:KRX07310.1 hypothetical protein PPERSA_06925 [Pseudocohnilembus persalinus]